MLPYNSKCQYINQNAPNGLPLASTKHCINHTVDCNAYTNTASIKNCNAYQNNMCKQEGNHKKQADWCTKPLSSVKLKSQLYTTLASLSPHNFCTHTATCNLNHSLVYQQISCNLDTLYHVHHAISIQIRKGELCISEGANTNKNITKAWRDMDLWGWIQTKEKYLYVIQILIAAQRTTKVNRLVSALHCEGVLILPQHAYVLRKSPQPPGLHSSTVHSPVFALTNLRE